MLGRLGRGRGPRQARGAGRRTRRRRVGGASGLVALTAANALPVGEAVSQVGMPAHGHGVLTGQRATASQVTHVVGGAGLLHVDQEAPAPAPVARLLVPADHLTCDRLIHRSLLLPAVLNVLDEDGERAGPLVG